MTGVGSAAAGDSPLRRCTAAFTGAPLLHCEPLLPPAGRPCLPPTGALCRSGRSGPTPRLASCSGRPPASGRPQQLQRLPVQIAHGEPARKSVVPAQLHSRRPAVSPAVSPEPSTQRSAQRPAVSAQSGLRRLTQRPTILQSTLVGGTILECGELEELRGGR